jgi:cell fate regulator YaaT (PSP1 superfamily)
MKIAEVQIAPWEKTLVARVGDLSLAVFDNVIIKTESGLDLAKVVDIYEGSEESLDKSVDILRVASDEDELKSLGEVEKRQILQTCHELIKQFNLAMKLVDVRASWDGSRLTFAFVAGGRVDFRELVKELTKSFNKNIRLQQIGIRDEAKVVGDQGRCGLGLCCREHLNKFSSVTSEIAEQQNLAGRGSDRLSGACGRLMCCLSYEAEGYKDIASKLPAIGSTVQIKGKSGVVVGHHLLKQTIDVRFKGDKDEGDYVAEVEWPK